MIGGAHAFIALARREPHWLLSEADAQVYGRALANALRHLPVKVAQAYVDYSTLAMVALTMDAPRVLRSRQLALAQAQRGPVPPGGATVFQFRRPAGAAPGTPPPNAGHAQPPPAGATFADEPETGGEPFGP